MSLLMMPDVLLPYLGVCCIAFAVAFIFTPAMRAVAEHYGIVDEPDGKRKMHRVPVAYLGGAAVFLGWMAGLAFSQFTRVHHDEPGLPSHVILNIGVVSGAIVIVLLGLWDDFLRVCPSMKIRAQIVAAGFLLYEGIGTRCAQGLLDPLGERLMLLLQKPTLAPILQWLQGTFGWPTAGLPFFSEWFVLVLSSAIVVVVVVGCCNAANLLDGLDGLCGGVTAIISAGLLFVALHLAATGSEMNANIDGTRVVIALALLGAVLGFVPYNFNPASIFLGDTGSMFLGFCCAVLILLNGQGQHPKWFLASMVIFALPVLDTVLALVRRRIHGRPLFSADHLHFHHQLCARGYSVKQTVAICYALASAFAVLGCLMVFLRTRYALAIYLLVFGFVAVVAYKLGMVHERTVAAPKPRVVPETAPKDPCIDERARIVEVVIDDASSVSAGHDATGRDAAVFEGVVHAEMDLTPT